MTRVESVNTIIANLAADIQTFYNGAVSEEEYVSKIEQGSECLAHVVGLKGVGVDSMNTSITLLVEIVANYTTTHNPLCCRISESLQRIVAFEGVSV